jgi:hypothetical protein
VFCGCTHVQTSAREPQDRVEAFGQVVPPEIVAETPSIAEPNHPKQENPVPDPNESVAEPVAPQQTVAPESNEPMTSNIAEVVDVPADEPTETVEPCQPDIEGTPVVEPNETPAAEPRTQEPQVVDESPGPMDSFYREYAGLLQQYVRQDGRVDYDSLRRKRLWIKELLRAPDELAPEVYGNWSHDEKLAFWINIYNLKMLDVIARNYPIESSWWLRLTWPPSDIRHIEGIWSNYRFIVMDEEFTLGEVERRFFRKLLADPRAYLAITYASRSGPAFRRQPYRGRDLGQQLDEQVRTFLSAGHGLWIDRDKGIVYLSALFKPAWRGKEFVARYGTDKKFKDRPAETRAVLNFLTHYISDDDVYFLEVENYSIEYTNFDWRLNDTSRGY